MICALEARDQLELDRVVWVPVGEPPHRHLAGDPGVEIRFELCCRAVEGEERFEVSREEMDRPGPSYTADTLARFEGADLFLILGGDQAAALGAWHQPREVLRRATVAAVERDDARRAQIAEAVDGVGHPGARLVFLDMPRIELSSSLIRERVLAGRPIRHLVPEGVERAIGEHDLYRRALVRTH